MGYGRARNPVKFEVPVSFSARDEFDQSAGALAGKTAPVGGTWAGAGDSDDFSVETSGKTAQRTAVSDTAFGAGRYAILGTTNFTDVIVQVDVKVSTLTTFSNAELAVLARYADTSNFVEAFWEPFPIGSGATSGRFSVQKKVAGARTILAEMRPATFRSGLFYTLRLHLTATGSFHFWAFPRGTLPASPVLSGQDSALATGGALATGKPGFRDNWTPPDACTRNYDNTFIAVPTIDAVVHSGQSAEFHHDIALRENAAGTSSGRVPAFDGKHLTLPAGTRADFRSRLVVKARRFDVDSGLPDTGLSDALSGTLTVTPRVVLLSKP